MTTQPAAPLCSPAQAAVLLDEVIYEQVLECVDLGALHRLEQSLQMTISELEGPDSDRGTELASAMLERAFARLPGELRGFLAAARWPFAGCELCEDDDAHEHAPTPAPPPPAPASAAPRGSGAERGRSGSAAAPHRLGRCTARAQELGLHRGRVVGDRRRARCVSRVTRPAAPGAASTSKACGRSRGHR
ncbi:MAG TPA: hypothetical protein VFK02_34970 [Kofleriaceae bacterium]|nr:hypothetical protein [Kofleriaceae bacterium]